MSNEYSNYQFITDKPDYRHLADKERYKALYEEVGTVPANLEIKWREEWMKHFHPHPGASILELGAHNGPNLLHYGRLGHDVTGVEISENLVKTFEKFRELESPEVKSRTRMHNGWIEEFTPPHKYDCVLITEVLEHVADPVVILKKGEECVAGDGFIYISSPSTHWGNNTHVRGVPPELLTTWLSEAGLSPISIFSEGGWTFAIARKSRQPL